VVSKSSTGRFRRLGCAAGNQHEARRSVLALAATAPASAAPLVYVYGRADFPAASGGRLATAGDFNADGRPDLVAVSYENNSVSILLGQPDGSFDDSGASYAVGTQPVDAAVGDFDQDGNLDEFGTISILAGNGDGTFQFRNTYATGRFSRQIVAGDFNNDGIVDLAQAELGSNLITLLKGRGDGTFRTQGRYGVGVGPIALAIGDFNGDQALDAAVVNVGSNTVSTWLSGPP